jgi:hypothetical protein
MTSTAHLAIESRNHNVTRLSPRHAPNAYSSKLIIKERVIQMALPRREAIVIAPSLSCAPPEVRSNVQLDEKSTNDEIAAPLAGVVFSSADLLQLINHASGR